MIPRVALPCALILLVACGGGGGGSTSAPAPQGSAPTIASFTAGPLTGGSATLTWSVSGATSLVLDHGVGTVSGTQATVAPGSTTTYTLTASNSYGTRTATATVTVGTPPATAAGMDLGQGASLNGYVPFPSDNAWNRDVSGDPVDPNSAAILTSIGLSTGLHADFGSGTWQGAPIGIPYVVVDSGQQAKVPVTFTLYGDESDPGPYPVPADAPIEGRKLDGSAFGGDRHVLVLDRATAKLYELGNAYPQGDGSWKASGGAVFDMASNALRPAGWTSADAAGLPIFPGLARYDEVAAGAIHHALRFTVSVTRKAYVAPARHWASSDTSASRPPMGMRVRLKASKDISGFPAQARVVLQALKTYGMIVADNGSDWYISGAPDARWDNSQLQRLGDIQGSDFEVVQMGTIVHP